METPVALFLDSLILDERHKRKLRAQISLHEMKENRGFNYGYGVDCLNQPLHRWVVAAMTRVKMWEKVQSSLRSASARMGHITKACYSYSFTLADEILGCYRAILQRQF